MKPMLAPRCLGSADREHGLGRGLEQEIVDDGLVLVGNIRDGRGQGEDLMEVLHGQQLSLTGGKPFACCSTLMWWTALTP